MMNKTNLRLWVKKSLGRLLKIVFRVRLHGFEHYAEAGERVLIVANHVSYLDPVLLWAFLPDEEVTFAISTEITRQWWARPAPWFVRLFPMNPTQPLAIKGLTHYLRDNRKAVIFPEGRISVTGGLMKIYDGAALIALKSGATVLPIRVDGPQYTRFSHLRGVVRMRWFPPITLTMCPPCRVQVDSALSPHQQRHQAGVQLADIMSQMMFTTGHWRRTLFSAVLAARRVHGGQHLTLEDTQRKPLSYDRLIAQSLLLGRHIALLTGDEPVIGVLLPNLTVTITVVLGVQISGKTPALLNPGAGLKSILSCCRAACLHSIVTSRRVVDMAGLSAVITQLQTEHRILYLEDLSEGISLYDKARAVLDAYRADHWYPPQAPNPDTQAVILFTSGSEGEPKGVVLSHANLLANLEQLAARVGFNAHDTVLNVLPVFHSFGLTAGTLLPLLSGMRVFLYPSPLHYRIIPEIAYDVNASLLFGTNTFLMGYGRQAHSYDFHRLRLVFAGAEKLQNDTRSLWMEKFGIRIMEGYGATETAPIIAVNTPMECRQGTVGRPMPGMTCRLHTVEGISEGGTLHVHGPNVMLGYLRADQPGVLHPPVSPFGAGWYDTGDVATIDADGFLSLRGRIKRFAKIGGEMVSLGLIEELATALWPGYHHAAITLADANKGEKILLVTTCPLADRKSYLHNAQLQGYSELQTPKRIHIVHALPLLATGKVDYPSVRERLINGTLD
ncbi:MAG: AMP-binding protein [Methylococcaceae bacterium]